MDETELLDVLGVEGSVRRIVAFGVHGQLHRQLRHRVNRPVLALVLLANLVWRVGQFRFVKQLFVVHDRGWEQRERDTDEHALVLHEFEHRGIVLGQVIAGRLGERANVCPSALETGATRLADGANDVGRIAGGNHRTQRVVRILTGVEHNVKGEADIFLRLVELVYPSLFERYLIWLRASAQADEPRHFGRTGRASFTSRHNWRRNGGRRDRCRCLRGRHWGGRDHLVDHDGLLGNHGLRNYDGLLDTICGAGAGAGVATGAQAARASNAAMTSKDTITSLRMTFFSSLNLWMDRRGMVGWMNSFGLSPPPLMDLHCSSTGSAGYLSRQV